MPLARLDQAQWVDRFMNRLGALSPSMSPADATERAIATWCDANDLEPEDAAEMYAIDLPPVDVGAPGD
jgi:hypothetical protein